jgi:hypothetical protein
MGQLYATLEDTADPVILSPSFVMLSAAKELSVALVVARQTAAADAQGMASSAQKAWKGRTLTPAFS